MITSTATIQHFSEIGAPVQGLYMGHVFKGTVVDFRQHTIDGNRFEATVELSEEMEFLGSVKPVGEQIIVGTDFDGHALSYDRWPCEIESL